jgi:DNA polymerase-3 subunit delta'
MFAEIFGHQQAKKQLAQAIESSRIAHAYLFTGPDGIGKKKTAIAFAKAINCHSGQGEDNCASCRKIEKDNHPDVDIIRADGQFIKIERIRELIEELTYKPYEGKKKVAIFDEAEKLTLQAMNTLLKTLEEPPGETLLILISSHPQVLLPTVRSRCQEVYFHPLSETDLQELIIKKKGVDPSRAKWISRFSGGSAQKAVEIDPEVYLEKQENLLKEIKQLDAKDIVSLFALSERLSKDKAELTDTLDILLNLYREKLPGEDVKQINTPLNLLQEVIEQIQKTIDLLQRNVNARLAMDNLLLFLADKNTLLVS